MIKKYMSRPHFTEAIQLTKDNLKEVLDFIGEHVDWPHCKSGGVDPKNGKLKFHLFGGGDETASVGDYIVRIKSDETRRLLHMDYVLKKKDIFEKQYVVDIEV